MRQAVCPLVEFSVSQLLTLKLERNRIRRALHLGLEKIVNAEVPWIVFVRGIPLHADPLALRFAENRQPGDAALRIGNCRPHQILEVFQHGPRRFRFEQIGVVFQRKLKALWAVDHTQVQIKLRGAVVNRKGCAAQSGQRQVMPRGLLHRQHHLEKGISSHRSFRP